MKRTKHWKTCQWTNTASGWWESKCGIEHGIDEGPIKFGYKFCPYCGLPISQKTMVVIDANVPKRKLLK